MSRIIAALAILIVVSISQSSSAQDFIGGAPAGISPGSDEQLYPYDSQEPWLHGHFQRMPFHGGFRTFRPYNYRHVFAQSQTAASWGMNPQMPYSHHFWAQFENQTKATPYQTYSAPSMAPTPLVTPSPVMNHAPQMIPGANYPTIPQPMYNSNPYPTPVVPGN